MVQLLVRFFVLICCCGFLKASFSQKSPNQEPVYISEFYAQETGLPVSSVNHIYQSDDGIIWMATMKGLLRFDGKDYKLFDVSKTQGIESNRMLIIQKGQGDSFWITTEPGYLIHYTDNEFKSYGSFSESYSKKILLDGDSLTWVLSLDGLKLKRENDFILVRPHDIAPDKKLVSTIRLNDGSVLFSSSDGRILKSVYPYEKTELYCELPTGLSGGSFWIRSDGSLWWFGRTILKLSEGRTTAPQNIAVLEASRPKTGEHVTRIDETGNGRIFIKAETGLFELIEDSISLVYRADRNVRTEAKRQGGGACHCENDLYWTFSTDSIFINGTFKYKAPQRVTSIYCDRENSVWITLSKQGVQRYQRSLLRVVNSSIGTNNYYGVYEDSDNVIWFGEWDVYLNYFRHDSIHTIDPKSQFGTICSFLETRDQKFFINNKYWRKNDRFDNPSLKNYHMVDEVSETIYSVFESSDSTVWFGTSEGLFSWDGHNAVRSRKLSEIGEVGYVLEDHRKDLWFASKGGGLHRYIVSEDRWKVYTTQNGLRSNNLRALWEDKKGFLWVASQDNGLNRLDRDREKLQGISTDKGLYSSGIHSFELDQYNRLWMSSDQGIFYVLLDQLESFFDGDRDRVTSVAFTEKDGMLNREANGGFQNSVCMDKDGTLWYPTQNGIVNINPASIRFDTLNQNTTISSVTSGDSLLAMKEDSYFLDRDQTDLKIQFISPNFRDQRRFKYRHKMEGLDNNWRSTLSNNEATYTNIPGGQYTFRVQTYVEDEQYPIAETSINIVKTPKVVETLWFKLLVLALSLSFFFGFYRIRLRALKKSQRDLEAKVKSRTASLNEQKKIVEKQKEELLTLNREKNKFFENISHEFRTPLTLIMGPLEELQKKQEANASGIESNHLKRIIRNSRRLQNLVEQLLDLTKLESGTARLTMKPGDLKQMLQFVAADYQAVAQQKNISFSIDLTDEPVIIEYDPNEIDKVFHNLLSNAFKFTPSGESIRLKLTAKEGRAIVQIIDTGPGISAQTLEKLFDRFYQIQKSEFQPGTGIGLSIAKEITNLHKGEIRVTSKVGEGTCFTVSLPISSKAVSTSEPPIYRASNQVVDNYLPSKPKSVSAKEHMKKVLIVEDNREIQAFIQESLSAKFTIIPVSSGNEAWAYLQKDLPDLIVSDIMMADGDGLSLLKKVRNSDELNFLPVVLLTSKGEISDKLGGLEFGADDYLTKPFNVNELELRIDNLIQQRMRLRKFFSEDQPGNSDSKINLEQPSVSIPQDEWTKKFHSYLDKQIGEEDLTVEALAAYMGMSRASLFRKSKSLFNESPAAIIKRLRMERAKSCLKNNMGNISEIAYSCGFSSLAHFSKTFKQYYGKSPSHFIESISEG